MQTMYTQIDSSTLTCFNHLFFNLLSHLSHYLFDTSRMDAAIEDKLVESSVWLPEGLWFDVCKNRMVEGNTTITQTYTLDDTPRFVKAGSIIPCYPHITNLKSCPEKLILEVYPGVYLIVNVFEVSSRSIS